MLLLTADAASMLYVPLCFFAFFIVRTIPYSATVTSLVLDRDQKITLVGIFLLWFHLYMVYIYKYIIQPMCTLSPTVSSRSAFHFTLEEDQSGNKLRSFVWFRLLFPPQLCAADTSGRMSYGSIDSGSFGSRNPFGGPMRQGYQPVGKNRKMLFYDAI